jgi:hypothetical protein
VWQNVAYQSDITPLQGATKDHTQLGVSGVAGRVRQDDATKKPHSCDTMGFFGVFSSGFLWGFSRFFPTLLLELGNRYPPHRMLGTT